MEKTKITPSILSSFKLFIQNNWLIIASLLLGAFLRLYKIDEYMTFLGDEGRDVLTVRNLLVKFDPILIGPGTSVGGMYLGPLYYYFMAPFLLLFNFNPVGPAIGVALLGIATIYLVYHVSNIWFGKVAAIVASLFFAVSPTVINYSHSSWNPNIMPFFAILSIFSIWKVWKEKKYNYLMLTAISSAFILNSHYLGLLILPVLFIYYLKSKVPIKYTVYSFLIFAFLMSPLPIFDFRHGFMNFNALSNFLSSGNNNLGFNFSEFILKTYTVFQTIITRLVTFNNVEMGKYVTIFFGVFVIFTLTSKKYSRRKEVNILLWWLFFGLLGFSIYKHPVYDHYFGFLFPAPFMLLGYFVGSKFEQKNKFINILLSVSLVVLFLLNIKNTPIAKEPNRLMQRAEKVALKIIEFSNNESFNIAVLSERNYEDGYQYFLEKENSKLIEIDPQLNETVTNQLFVICELPKEKCDPTHSAKAEVANFGWSKIDSEFEIDGVTIYKLIHSK